MRKNMNKHLSRTLCKAGRYAVTVCVLTAVLSACGKEDDPVNKQPVYTYQKEKEYLFTMPVYNDVIRFYKYNTRITQTNPDAVVSEEEIKAKEEEINQKVEIVDHGDWRDAKVVMRDVGFEINDQAFDYNLCMTCFDKTGYIIKPDKYAVLGRDSLITLFKYSDLYGLTTTFDFLKDEFQTYFSANADLNEEVLNWFIGDDSYGGDLRINSSAYRLNTNLSMPDECIKEYMLIYDRFDSRSYIDDKGNTYLTKVVIKYLRDVKDFDRTAKSPYSFDMTAYYPVVQLFKNGELIYEGKTYKYTEEYQKTCLDTRTNVEFRACTLTEQCCYVLGYRLYYGQLQFELRLLDYANPDPGENFSTKSTDYINIIEETKNDSKKTISFMETTLY